MLTTMPKMLLYMQLCSTGTPMHTQIPKLKYAITKFYAFLFRHRELANML